MLKVIFKHLEDPSRPLLGPNVKLLKFWGLLLPKKKSMKYYYFTMHFLVTLYVVTEYIDIWFSRTDIKLFVSNLKITILTTLSVAKLSTFIAWQKDWKSIIEYVTNADIEQRKSENSENMAMIAKSTKYCRKMTLIQCCLMYTIVVLVISQPIIMYIGIPSYRKAVKNGTEPYYQVISAWVPFNKNTPTGYIMAQAFQYYMVIFGGGGWITSYDSTAVAIMVFFKAELELLRQDSALIFGTDSNPVTDEEGLERIKKCHERHVVLLEFAKHYNNCMSPIMFIYMLVCSLMLCLTAYEIIIDEILVEKISSAMYLMFSIAQLFIYYWHANDVFHASSFLLYGPYESLWSSRSIKLKKNIHILSAQFKTLVICTAGPFTDLTLATFISILKLAYSYYTLLSQSQM